MSASRVDAADDRQLVERYLDGRGEIAFVALYRRHTPALFRCAMRLVGGRENEAEELVQEAWCRALRGLGAFRWESALRTWLIGVVGLCAREAERARQRAGSSEGSELDALSRTDPGSEDGGQGSFERVSNAELERAIAELPPGYRQVLVLHDLEGWKHDAIARLLEIAPGTSKSQLSRARRRLRAALLSRTDAETRGGRR